MKGVCMVKWWWDCMFRDFKREEWYKSYKI